MHISTLIVSIHFWCTFSHILQPKQTLVRFVMTAEKEFLATVSACKRLFIFRKCPKPILQCCLLNLLSNISVYHWTNHFKKMHLRGWSILRLLLLQCIKWIWRSYCLRLLLFWLRCRLNSGSLFSLLISKWLSCGSDLLLQVLYWRIWKVKQRCSIRGHNLRAKAGNIVVQRRCRNEIQFISISDWLHIQ